MAAPGEVRLAAVQGAYISACMHTYMHMHCLYMHACVHTYRFVWLPSKELLLALPLNALAYHLLLGRQSRRCHASVEYDRTLPTMSTHMPYMHAIHAGHTCKP